MASDVNKGAELLVLLSILFRMFYLFYHYALLNIEKMADAVVKLQKPQLRGLLAKNTKFHLPVAIALSILVGVVYKFTINDPRKRKYSEFYKNYDADKEFERMKKAGIFTSVSADD